MRIRVEYNGQVSQEVDTDPSMMDATAKALRTEVIELSVKKIRESGLSGSNIDLTIACMVSSLIENPAQIRTVIC